MGSNWVDKLNFDSKLILMYYYPNEKYRLDAPCEVYSIINK